MAIIKSPIGDLPHIPDNLTVVQFILDYHCSTRPKRKHGATWLVEDGTGRKIGFEELCERTFGLANALSFKYNIGENDVVLIFSRNHVDYPVAIWATHRLGGIISTVNPDYTIEELVYQLEQTNATVIIAYSDAIEIARAAARTVGISFSRIIVLPDPSAGFALSEHHTIDELITEGLSREAVFVERVLEPGEAKTKVAFLCFSSGTTGKAKAVAIPHISFITNVVQLAIHNKVNEDYTSWEERRFRPGDVALCVLPCYHIYGLHINLHFMLFAAMSVVIVPRFNFIEMIKSIVRHRVTHLCLVPPQAVLFCKHPAVREYDLSRVRFIMIGAAPFSKEINKQLIDLFPDAHIGQAYGMTETCTVTTMWPTTQKNGTSGGCGQLLPGVIARVVKQDGSLAGVGEPGELVLKSPSNALCYANNEQATKDTFVNGWVHTGDEVYIDERSEIFVVDRLKEIMKVKGYQVAPAELEGYILDHADVSDTCVVGVPDDYSGEVPLAFVVLNADAAKQVAVDSRAAQSIKASIMKHVADNKVAYKQIAGGVEFVDVIPKNPSGKLLRRLLREKARALRPKVQAKL